VHEEGSVSEGAAMYLPDRDGYTATIVCQGGWDPAAQHGGPVEGLLARGVERVPSLVPMQPSRFTFDLVRPVPMGRRLHVDTSIVREGKKIQVVQAVLRDGELELARALALRLRLLDVADAVAAPADPPAPAGLDLPLPPPEEAVDRFGDQAGMPGFLRSMTLRRIEGDPAGRGIYWVRLRVPLVAGEETSPISRLAVVGDYTSLIGVMSDLGAVSAINPDVSLQIARAPEGEWVAVAGTTTLDRRTGIGHSVAALHDRGGVVAHSTASQLVEPRR
jgi:hypothetical protein